MSKGLRTLEGKGLEEATQAITQMSNEQILGGSFVGEDLQKRVKALIVRYHPDKPNGDVPTETRNLVTQTLIKIKEGKRKDPEKKVQQKDINPGRKSPEEEFVDDFIRRTSQPSSFNPNDPKSVGRSIARDLVSEYESNAYIRLVGAMIKIEELGELEKKYKLDFTKEKEFIAFTRANDIIKSLQSQPMIRSQGFSNAMGDLKGLSQWLENYDEIKRRAVIIKVEGIISDAKKDYHIKAFGIDNLITEVKALKEEYGINLNRFIEQLEKLKR